MGARVLLVKKKDGDMRSLLIIANLTRSPSRTNICLPWIDDLLDQLKGDTIFSMIDLRLGNHQIRVKNYDTLKAAFRTQYGHYEFLAMSFRVIDEILIYSRNS